MKNRSIIFAVILPAVILLKGCVEYNDTPPLLDPFAPGEIVTIEQVKQLYAAELAKPWTERTPVQITEEWSIAGLATATDKKNGNLYKEGFIEDQSSGLLMKFESTGGLFIGDSIIVNLQGLWLSDYGNFIQLGGVPYTDDSGNKRLSGFNKDERILRYSMGNLTRPALKTISQAKNSSMHGRLVTFNDVQFSDSELGKTYADADEDPPASANRYLTDCSGNRIIVRSSGYATFAGTELPEGKGTITGVVTVFNSDYQLIIRDIDEVMLDGDRCPPGGQVLGAPVETISQNFTGFANNQDVFQAGWQNFAQAGSRLWRAQVFSGNTYAQATGYLASDSEIIIWFIPPPIILSTQKVLTFQTSKAYWAHQAGSLPFEVLFSTNYNGTNISTATWTPLTAVVAGQSDTDHVWVNSGNVNLPVISGGTGVIGFRYRGSNVETTSYRIDNLLVTAAK
ncbi:MAG: choice-of-anchor J domain-containing protein [Bacteroidales bacterium]|nr:choice-of-anchor J domain-containing protein [Bacteroidales bacterium]